MFFDKSKERKNLVQSDNRKEIIENKSFETK
jgi:hypothetical protein